MFIAWSYNGVCMDAAYTICVEAALDVHWDLELGVMTQYTIYGESTIAE